MNPKNLFLVITLLCSVFTGYGQTTDLIISEYGEGSVDNSKYIEIYNGTGASVNLTNYVLWKIINGGTWPKASYTFTSTTLVNGATIVIANNVTDTAGADEYDSVFCSWNGDDAVGLVKSGVLIDAVGTDGADPGSGWDVAGIVNGTVNNRLIRKSTVCSPNTNWTTSAGTNTSDSEWTVVSYNTTGSANAGHTASCAVATPTITVSPTTLTGLDYSEGSGPSLEQTFTVSGTDLTANITLTPPANFEISTSSGAGFGSSITLVPISNTVSSTTIYVRLASGLAVNTYGPSNITANSNFATTKNVAVSGEVTAAPTPCAELFISEYIEGSGTNKNLELYNPTSSSIDLANYQIALFANGSVTASSTTALSGSLAAYTTYVIANSGSTSGTIDLSNDTATGFNGNDVIALQTSVGVNIDVVGVIGSSANFALDIGLQRKNTVQNPSTSYSASEWNILALDDVSSLGSHTSDCAVTSPTITVSANSLIGLDYVFGSGPSAEQTFTVSGSDLTTDIDLTAPTNFEISTTPGGGFLSSLTLTQTGGIVNTTTIYVRLLTGLIINAYTGNLNATSTGATAKNITFDGEVTCVPTHTITNFAPASGPIGSEVTITGTGFSAGSTVDFDGVNATVTYINSTTLITEVPTGAISYVITVNEAGCSLNSSSSFTVLSDNGCVGGVIPAGWSDLMFSGIYDDPISSCHYFELFNPTASDIDLSAYTIGFDNNFTYGSSVPTSGFTGGSITLSGTIAAESTFMVQVSSSGICNTCTTIVPDLTFANGGINIDDRLVLLNGSTIQDVWQNHSSRPGYDTIYNEGYIYSINILATAPATTFDLVNWSSNGTESCFGFALSSAVLPTINTQPVDASGCSSVAFMIAATTGGGGTLTYQWKYNDGSASGWSNVLNSSFSPGTVTGETSNNLTISGFNVDGYQFYCEVTENGSCAVSSDAAQVTTQTTSWDGSNWSIPPSISTTVIINGNYNTGTNGSFIACSLIVNDTFSLTVDNSTYVEVENDVTINGTLVVETQGSFVQNSDAGLFTVNVGGTSSVNKTTAPLNNWYEYTYWSSPVLGETIGVGLANSPIGRRFWYNAQNYLDATKETGNDNAIVPGQDGVDDNGNTWQYAAAANVMIPGVGYAATQSSSVLSQYDYTFTGPFNNGVITVPVYRNDAELLDDNSNFIGNPYASAIDADIFFNTNVNSLNPSGALDGIIYLWSHNTPPSNVANGNEDQNFAQSDYAIINGGGQLAGGDGVIPSRNIPSGQGFFTSFSNVASATVVSGTIKTGDVIFNNSMRAKAGNNQFFKTSDINKVSSPKNKIWINLTSNNGVFNQLTVVYVNGATNANDGSYYDAKKSIPTGKAAIIYSLIEGDSEKFAIQGKDLNSLNLKEKFSLGFQTSIDIPTQFKLSLAKFEGDFVTNQPIYLKDSEFNLYHNLSKSDYSFTAEPGEYNNRFEISFRDGSQPINNLNPNELVIFELNDGNVQFTINDDLTIKNIVIIDILGRKIYNFKGSNYTETYNLSKLGTSVYIAKVELSNGEIIIKKAIKKL
ncbi:lamin tail domain-containing protein [Lutibacter sp.]|uniref:lamin tail domain-containing protein n=1 Tax=Lutibacter sp. TaxID=1925666 RepID=UPI003564D078